MKKQFYIYIMTNNANTVLYTGMTNDLKIRIYEHKEKLYDGLTKRYNIDKLVYYEVLDDVNSAIYREKQIKNYSRQKKMALIDSLNPKWEDLYREI